MKQILKDTIEQIKGPEKPEQATEGLKEQADLSEMLKSGWKQILGQTEGAKKFQTTEALKKGQIEDERNRQYQIGVAKKILNQEKTIQPQKPKPNLPVITPVKPSVSSEPPPYIRGKPEYSPDQKQQDIKAQNQLPALVVPKSKARRGSFTDYLERKQKGPEIKGGPSG